MSMNYGRVFWWNVVEPSIDAVLISAYLYPTNLKTEWFDENY